VKARCRPSRRSQGGLRAASRRRGRGGTCVQLRGGGMAWRPRGRGPRYGVCGRPCHAQSRTTDHLCACPCWQPGRAV